MARRSTAPSDTAPAPPLLLDPAIMRNWRQPRRLTVSEWADENRVLDPLFAAEPGPWRTDRAPYAREVMDSANKPWVRRVTWMASTQVGKSETMNNVGGYYIHQRPSPAMFVLPNRDAARLAAERRILPMVRASDALLEEMTDRAHDAKNREIVFRRSVLYMRSANSPTDLASVPVRLVLCDEVDKWPQWSGREADPLSLVMERTRTFHDYCVFVGSTPTTRDGIVFREFEQGDRRRFHVPCPHCAEMQVLTWQNVKWDSQRVRTERDMLQQRSAWYQCAHCGERIVDRHKRAMLRDGVWVPEGIKVGEWLGGVQATERNEHRSYHLWAAYSPWVSFWKLAAQFLRSKDEPAKLMNFTNSWLAEVWEERIESTSDEAIAACIGDYDTHTVHKEALVITAAVDVQVDYMVWQVVAWGYDEESWVIAMGTCETFEQLEAELVREWGSQRLPPRCIVIDSRYRRDEVLDFARRNPSVRMIAGVERKHPQPFSTIRLERHPRTGAMLPKSQTIWTINVGMFKDLVAHRMRLAIDKQENPIGVMHLPRDLDSQWLEQMAAEHKVTQRSGGRVRSLWVLKPGRKRNEAWDLLVYNAAAAKMVRADLLRSDGHAPVQPTPQAKHTPRVMGKGNRGGGVDLPRGRW